MERLPQDVANERLHHDIVTLLKEHHPRSPQMPQVVASHLSHSQSHHHHQQSQQGSQATPQPSQRSNAQAKGKQRRPKSTIMSLPNGSVAQMPADASTSLKRSSSVKKKRDQPTTTVASSPFESLGNGPFETNIYSAGGIGIPRFREVPVKQPPPYDECMKASSSLTNLHQISDRDTAAFASFASIVGGPPAVQPQQPPQKQPPPQPQQTLHPIHPRQQSMPASFSPPTPKMTPAHSHHHMTPPHSSPQYALSPHNTPPVTSPGKMRPAMPTSPTHIAALRHATASAGFDFPAAPSAAYGQQGTHQAHPTSQQQQQNTQGGSVGGGSYYPHYPTPPSHHSGMEATPQHTLGAHDAFPTPSPESPGQWSSASPHSQSDWSEGGRSPMGVRSPHAQTNAHLHQHYQNNGAGTSGHQTVGLPKQNGQGSIYI